LWLFSRRTLDAIPDVYEEVDMVRVDRHLPVFLKKAEFGGVRLFAWLALFVLLPILYWILGGVDVAIAAVLRRWRGAPIHGRPGRQTIPGFVRLLLMAIAIRWATPAIDLPLVERQFWSIVAAVLVILAFVWALLRLNNLGERWLKQRSKSAGHGE